MTNRSQSVLSTRRADIQILRGVAVLGVMLAHFGALVPGGFLGVDVFFAISGFVITLSLWSLHKKKLATRRLLGIFWRRRFFRLVPVLVVVLTATLIGASLSLTPRDFGDQVEMTVWSLFFAGNIGVEIVSQGDYFDPAAKENWLLHLWSLGVEEQFYLLFPFLFLGLIASRWGRSHPRLSLLWVTALAAVSFGAALLNEADVLFGLGGFFTESTGLSALFGYYSPVTRAWQFLVGVAGALIVIHRGAIASRWLPLIGGAGLLLAFIAMPESNLLPDFSTLLPMLSVFLVLISKPVSWSTNSRVLTPLRWLGDRSYSAYLWHWPVWLFLQTHIGSGLFTIASAFLLTVVLSALSYRLIELPFIARGRESSHAANSSTPRSASNPVLALLASLPLLVGFGTTASYTTLQDRGLLVKAPPVPQLDADRDCVKTDCSDRDIDVLLIGDSHAGSLGNALQKRLAEEQIELYGAVVARHFGCLHLPSRTITSVHEECRDLSERVRDLVTLHTPPIVIVHGYTAGRFTEINSGGDAEIALVNNTTGEPVTAATGADAYEESLQDTVGFLRDSGAHVVIVSGVPDFTLRPEDVGRAGEPASQAELLFAPWFDWDFGQDVTKQQYLERHGDFVAIDQKVATAPSVSSLEPWDALCSSGTCSQSSEDGKFLYADTDHVSDLGATHLAEAITRHLEENGLLECARGDG